MSSEALRAQRVAAYESPRPEVQELVPASAKTILDLGCSSGAIGAALKARQAARVVGVEIDHDYAEAARDRLDMVYETSLVDFAAAPPEEPGTFDCIVAADVLEHLPQPDVVLREIVTLLKENGTIVISVPNIQYWRALQRIVTDRHWPRETSGIFDSTHLSWFTVADAVQLVETADCEVTAVRPFFWDMHLWLVRRFARTRLRRFLAAQTLVAGVRRPNRCGP